MQYNKKRQDNKKKARHDEGAGIDKQARTMYIKLVASSKKYRLVGGGDISLNSLVTMKFAPKVAKTKQDKT